MAGLAIAVVALALDRLAVVGVPMMVYWLPPAVGIACGIIAAVAQAPSMSIAAIHLDRRLHLKDRIATAEALQRVGATGGLQGELAPLVEVEAQRLAARLDVRSATPIRFSNSWLLASALACLLAAGVAYVPQLRTSRAQQQARLAAEQHEQLTQQAQSVAEEIKTTVDPIDRSSIDVESAEQLEALDRLAEQLLAPGNDPRTLEQAREESAARMSDLAEQIQRESQRDDAAADELLERFAGMQAPEAPMTADQFAEALRRGEFGRAADSIDDLLAERDAMAEDDRSRIADELRELGNTVRNVAQSGHDPAIDERVEQLRQALRDHGVDEQTIDELLSSESSSDDSLSHENIDEQLADRMQDDLQKLQDQREIDEQASRDAKRLADALREAAEQLEHGPPPDEAEPSRSEDSSTEQSEADDASAAEQHPEQKPPQDQAGQPTRDRAQNPQQNAADKPAASKQADRAAEDRPKPRGGEQPASSRQQDLQGKDRSEPSAADRDQSAKPSPQDSGQQQPSPSKGGTDPTQPAPNEKGNSRQETQQQTAGEKPTPADSKPEPKQGDQDGAQSGDEQRNQPGAKPTPGSNSAPGDQRNEQPNAQSGTRDTQPSPRPDSKDRPDHAQGGHATRPDEPSADTPGDNSPSGDQPATGEQSSADGTRRPTDKIRDVANRRDGAARRREISEQLREAAERMASGRRPESAGDTRDRGAGADSGESPRRDSQPPRRVADGADAGIDPADGAPDLAEPPPFAADDVQDVNLSGEDPGEQIIAQWLTDEPVGEASESTAGEGGRIATAQRAAQRAIEQSAVPPRYRGPIQRFFGRLPETVKRAGAGASVPTSTPNAPPDAPPTTPPAEPPAEPPASPSAPSKPPPQSGQAQP